MEQIINSVMDTYQRFTEHDSRKLIQALGRVGRKNTKII